MHPSSHRWVHPRVRENAERQKINLARRKLCPRSAFWTQDFDLAQHRKDWEAGRSRRAEQQLSRKFDISEKRQKLQNRLFPLEPELKPAFGGKELIGRFSSVLCQETVFSPRFDNEIDGKLNVADWPSKSEMKYEGDDRISTDKIHGRFLGAPRVPGNETVNWQMRALIWACPMDEFLYPPPTAEDVMLKQWSIPYFEFTQEEGEEAIGKELLELLDPDDQWV